MPEQCSCSQALPGGHVTRRHPALVLSQAQLAAKDAKDATHREMEALQLLEKATVVRAGGVRPGRGWGPSRLGPRHPGADKGRGCSSIWRETLGLLCPAVPAALQEIAELQERLRVAGEPAAQQEPAAPEPATLATADGSPEVG